MNRISMAQALGLWSDLCDAYHGKGWGGDTAEVYLYRLMPRNPSADNARSQDLKSGISAEARAEQVRHANESLYDLLCLFAEERACRVQVDGRDLGEWLKRADCDHRVHVRVTPKGD